MNIALKLYSFVNVCPMSYVSPTNMLIYDHILLAKIMISTCPNVNDFKNKSMQEKLFV